VMVLDVAHNPAGAWALRSTLSEAYPDRNFTIVFGAMADKAIQEMADILFPLAQQIVVTPIANPRAATTDQLLQAGSRSGTTMEDAASVPAALARACDITAPDGVIVVTGSIFLVGEAMKTMGIPT
jgi:dihydrofolate synthase/folylpolyglutamate synthase